MNEARTNGMDNAEMTVPSPVPKGNQNLPAPRAIFSPYDDTNHIRKIVRDGHHRAVIGGLWDELGSLQHSFLKTQGLLPQHALLDVGAGSFRAGVRLIPYLDVGNYYAIELQAALLEAGYAHEIEPAGLAERFPRRNFAATSNFEASGFHRIFDYGIAQSVFTHMPITRLADCLKALAPHFRAGGLFFVTVFFCRDDEAHTAVKQGQSGVVTSLKHDPFHTTVSALNAVSKASDHWQMNMIGEWGHPKNQQMVSFTRRGS
jgi:hypothetical protein